MTAPVVLDDAVTMNNRWRDAATYPYVIRGGYALHVRRCDRARRDFPGARDLVQALSQREAERWLVACAGRHACLTCQGDDVATTANDWDDPWQTEVVYYVLVGDVIKIGTTRHLGRRMRGYPPYAEVLATEPGGRDLERQRHREFGAFLSHGREWFNPSRPLLEHIQAVTKYTVRVRMAISRLDPTYFGRSRAPS